MSVIRAVTFGFESTLYVPRERDQLESIRLARAKVLRDALADAGFPFSPAVVDIAYQPPSELSGVAVTVADTVDAMCEGLGIDLSLKVRRRLIRALDDLAGGIKWQHAPGAPAVLRHLRQRDYKLGLVANVHFPPSRVIRQVLAADGTLMYFQAFAFSDEVGACKPDPAIFRHVLYHLDLETTPEAVVHVGNDPKADVAGARAAGMRTVRFAGYRDQAGEVEADAVIHDFRELPALIRDWR